MNKKFLAKVVLASVLVGGINLLPIQNIEVGNVQISAVAYAENKNFSAKEAAMTDVEIIEAQAKEASRMRAIEAVKEKIASYVRNYSGSKGKLSEDDIAAIAEKFEEVGTAKYKKLFYNAVDEDGRELGKVGIMYEATVTAKFNSKRITEHIKLTEQEKAKRIRQAREAREKFEELDREYEELRKNARTKTPEQLQAEIKDFDDKISDLEKSRNKSAKTNKPVKKDKPTTKKSKILENVPMQFSQITKVGSIFHTPSSGVIIRKADYISSNPIGTFQGEKTYGNFTARWGDENNGIYCQWDKYPPTFGSKNGGIAVQTAVDVSIEKIKNSKNMPLYMIIVGNSDIRGTNFYLIGERPDGKWVKYFDTNTIKQSYPLPQNSYLSIKYSVRGDTVVIPYEQFQNRNRVAIGEFRFKWDESAKWFGVEKITYDQKPTAQKPAQENKPVITQPMQFSQPIYIGHAGSIAYIGQDRHYKGGVFIKGSSYNDGNILRNTGNSNIGPEYGSGTAIWGNGKDALYCKYECYDWYDNSVIAQFRKQKLSFGGKNQYIFSDGTRDISKINTNNGITLYALYYRYKLFTDLDIIGCRQDGKWVKYIDMNSIIEKYFGSPNKRKGEVIIGSEVRAVSEETQKYINCKGDTIIIPYVTVIWHPNEIINKGEFRFKWAEKAQWFSVEQIKY